MKYLMTERNQYIIASNKTIINHLSILSIGSLNDIKCTITVKSAATIPKGTDFAIYLTGIR
jgi:hypothetical protein